MNPIIDFHSHILPRIDDGSRNSRESIDMLLMGKRQGVDHIVATPHFYAYHSSVSQFLEKRKASYERLQQRIEEAGVKEGIPEILLGAEVYYFSGMGKAEQLPLLCIEGTNILLLEMPFTQWDRQMLDNLKQIIYEQKLTVVLAHIERFYGFQKKKDIWKEVLELPIYLQINAGCFEEWKKKRIVCKLLKKGYPVIMGSDCHNMETRKPNLKSGRDSLKNKFGEACLDDIDELGQRILWHE